MQIERKDRPMQTVCHKAGNDSGKLEMKNKKDSEDRLPDGIARGFPDKECFYPILFGS